MRKRYFASFNWGGGFGNGIYEMDAIENMDDIDALTEHIKNEIQKKNVRGPRIIILNFIELGDVKNEHSRNNETN